MDGALCSIHDDEPAVDHCHRCGTFVCRKFCARSSRIGALCAPCYHRPYELLKARYFGKTDGFVLLIGGFGSLVAGLCTIGATVDAMVPYPRTSQRVSRVALAVFLGILTLACLGYLFRRAWSRHLVAIVLVFPGLWVVRASINGNVGEMTSAVVCLGIAASLVFGAYNSTVNRLAFRLDVPQRKLEELAATASNPAADLALVLGVVMCWLPGAGLFAILFGVLGVRAASRRRHPPIARRTYALVGLVAGVISTLFWGGWFVLALVTT